MKTLDEIFDAIEKQLNDYTEPSPEEIEANRTRLREAIEAETGRLTEEFCGKLIGPEILDTDTEHPAFNRGAWRRVRDNWKPDSGEWLWLYSATSGVCKTRIAYLATRELVRQHYAGIVSPEFGHDGEIYFRGTHSPSVLWIDGAKLSEACRVRHQFSLGKEAQTTAHHLIETAKASSLLVIDDLTKRRMDSETVSDGFWEIISERHQWKRRTIITDNQRIDDLERLLHQKHAAYIMRRLAERCAEACFDR